MNGLLQRLKIKDSFTIELEIPRRDFIKRLGDSIDVDDTGLYFSMMDIFSSGRKEFKGKVTDDGFRLRRRRRIFDSKMMASVAIGTYRQKDNMLVIETEVNSFHGFFIFFLIFLIVFYGVAFGAVFFIGSEGLAKPLIAIAFLFLHAGMMLGIPYFAMRRSTQRMKSDLEREFYFLTKKI